MNNLEKNNLNEKNSEIDKVFDEKFNRLVGFVYIYSENWYNETLFKDYLWLDLENYKLWEDLVFDAKEKLKLKISELERFIKKVESDEIKLYETKNYYLKSFYDNLELIRNYSYIIEIEAQKIKTLNYRIPKEKLENYFKKMDNFDKKIFWDKLSENANYYEKIINDLDDLIKEKQDSLSEEESIFIKWILNQLKQNYSKKEVKNLGILQENEELIYDSLKDFDKNILKKEIERDDYIEIFKLVAEILWIKLEIELNEKIWNIDATINKENENKLRIPTKENYNKLTVERIINLLSHEIETHMITRENNQTLVWSMKPAWYTIKEEWIATTFWNLSAWKNIKEKVWLNTYSVLICEIYDWETFKKAYEILKKLTDSKTDSESKFWRYKRWRDFNLPWVNPKEKSYFIWEIEVKERIRKRENVIKLFLWKNNFNLEDEISKLAGIENNFSFSNLKEKNIVLPMMIWEIIKYKLLTKNQENKSILWFFKYFNEKYWEILEAQWVNYRNFIRDYDLKAIQEENREKVKKILQIMKNKFWNFLKKIIINITYLVIFIFFYDWCSKQFLQI